MLQSKSNWKFKTISNETTQWMDDSSNLSPVMKELLIQRGISTIQEAQDFISPKLENLFDPRSFQAIEKASTRVHTAIEQQEKILVYGDYDADGVSSTTVLLKTLRELGANCDYYIPNRFTEGYGPNEAAFQQAFEDGYSVIITVDTGIASVYEAEVAKQLGIDLIITDHHEPQEELPDAYAILHPKLSPEYPFKELAGVGVAFKFSQHLLGYFPEHLLDLVAIGTVADLVPLIDENRILTYYGLRKLSDTKRLGLKALMSQCKIEGAINEQDIGFLIGPRLNAVGRLQDADLAVQLLLTEDQAEAEELAEVVNELNQERQQIVASIVKEAEAMVDLQDHHSVIVVAKSGWNEGVLGIVASRLVKKYDRPAIVLAINEEKQTAKGSARSIPAFDLFQNCMKMRSYFTHFGGHSQAAGMTLPLDHVGKIEQELNQLIKDQLTADDFKQEIAISKTICVPEINEELVSEIDQLAPFGMANPKPIFHLKHTPSDIRQLGSMKNHLKIHFKENDKVIEGIGFGMGDLYHRISPQTEVSVVGELGINEWNGIKKPQLVLQDMSINEWQLFDHRGKKQFDAAPYFSNHERHVLLSNKEIEEKNVSETMKQITYHTPLETIERADVLYIYDLPTNLAHLKEIINQVQPVNIHVCFYVENSSYLSPMPTRDDFKWFYALLYKRKQIDLNTELQLIMDAKGWKKDQVVFISKVFFELEFVKIENGVIQLNSAPVKKDLQESNLYQERINKAHIEKTLYYSTYQELYNWFQSTITYMDSERLKEELTYGL
ncbi:single-stranded-DNA-specific exonuclease RecJ [Ornithinibacillus sp. L9]|uniref:Single-stranded-DNA-specific exonuclease RecJ n=1 Tax=Ornithinibacillus caprae TaxID=2678566 RepID=A0A6N8FBG9_9BACI|nr:single-stranded-DNA-specific exonuclease RecJ [Ornithinibacillus caprae]MUK87002.1 single-stranded-DNA-specific exonuclease RecJ [Ornithinibacillus caprae]